MPHLPLFGLKITAKGIQRLDLCGDALNDPNSGGFECGNLFGIVGHQTHGSDAEQAQDGSRQFVGSAIGGVAEFQIRFHGVAALILKLVSLELGHETDAAALLLFVEKNSNTFGGDAFERQLKLGAAVAALRAEDIAGEALGVDADDRCRGMNVAMHEGDEAINLRFCGGIGGAADCECRFVALETKNAEVAPARGEIGFGFFLYAGVRHDLIVRCAGTRRDSSWNSHRVWWPLICTGFPSGIATVH